MAKNGKSPPRASAVADADWGALLGSAQKGDADAYRRFLAGILPFVRAVSRRHCWSEDQVDDIVQDVLLTIHRVRHTYEPGRPVKPWLAAIAVRRAIDAARRRGRIGAREVNDERAYETFADPRANQEVERDAPGILAGMTVGLSAAQREAIDLVKVKEMSLREAAVVSGQTIASLKVNIHRAMKKMRLNLMTKASK